jgi:hypothetical protein
MAGKIGGPKKGETKTRRDERLRDNLELTAKQKHFAQCVANGMTHSAAYREAYTVREGTKKSVATRRAHELLQDSRITAMVDRITAAKERAIANAAIDDRKFVTDKLRPATTLRATELLGKTAGLFNEVTIDDKRQHERTPEEIQQEVDDMLALSEADIDTVNTDDGIDTANTDLLH